MTHCERILRRLERGPASAAELYAETFSIVHSRVADLRKRGYAIACERVPGESGAASYIYRLSEGLIASDSGQQPSDSSMPILAHERPLAETASPSPASTPSEAGQLLFALDPYSRRVA